MTPIDLLRKWFQENGESRASLARSLGISGASVSAWMLGQSRPETHYRFAIERVTEGKVTARSWMTDAEQRVAFGDDPKSSAKPAKSGKAAA